MDNYRTIERKLRNLEPFKGNSLWARFENWEGRDFFCVYSYQTRIAVCHEFVVTYLDPNKYSTTTTRHQNLVRKAWGI